MQRARSCYNYLCTYALYSSVHNVLDAAYLLRGEVGGGWALEFLSFLGPVKWERAVRRVPFGARKTWEFQGPTPPTSPSNGSAPIQNIMHGAV
jgi:hypothetical protein